MESVECLQSKINELLERHSLVVSVDRTDKYYSCCPKLYITLGINIKESESGEVVDFLGLAKPFETNYGDSSYQEFLEEVYDFYLRNWVVGNYKKELGKNKLKDYEFYIKRGSGSH